MATQTLEFNAGPGLTISCKLFAVGSDTVVDTQTATEKTNAKNRYSVAFTDLPAGSYQLIGFVGAVGGFANEIYDTLAATGTYAPRSEERMRGTDGAYTGTPPTASAIASQTRTELTTELGRIDAAVSTRSTLTAQQVWEYATRTLTAISDSAGITTLLARITGLLQTKAQADTDQAATIAAIEAIDTGGGGGASTSAIVSGVLAGLGATEVTLTQPLDVDSNSLTLIQRDDYLDANSRGIRFDLTTAFPEGDDIIFGATKRGQTPIEGAGVVTVDGDDVYVEIQLASDDLDRLEGEWDYSLTHVNATGKRHTFVNARLILEKVHTP